MGSDVLSGPRVRAETRCMAAGLTFAFSMLIYEYVKTIAGPVWDQEDIK